jgi:hypothetical protein
MAKKKVTKKTSFPQKWHAGPVKGSFMVMSMVGFLVSLYLVENINYKTAFILVFIAMFIASIISMTHAPIMNEKEVK